VKVVRVDPYHPVAGLLMPQITQRMIEYSKQLSPELNAVIVTKELLLPVWAAAQGSLLLAFVDEKGAVAGHCLANITSIEDGTRVAFIHQLKADGNVGDALRLALETVEAFGRQHQVAAIVMTTSRSEKAWEKAAGFREYRRILVRELPALDGATA